MSPPRIDLADPTSEGTVIAEALRARGFYLLERSLESLRGGTDAALVILAGDVAGALGVLAGLRSGDTITAVPVILIGMPSESTADGQALGADASYSRPVPIDRLTRKVETYLAPPETRLKPLPTKEGHPEQTMELGDASVTWNPDEGSPSEAEVSRITGDGAPREETPDEPDLIIVPGPDDDLGAVTGVSLRDDLWSVRDAANALDPDNPVSQVARRSSLPAPAPVSSPPPPIPSGERADLSARLTTLFREADRRVFPDGPALELTFDAGEAPARVLVPDDMLDAVHVPAEARDEDPLEAFTYIGGLPQAAPPARERHDPEPSFAALSLARIPVTAPDAPARPPPTSRHELRHEAAPPKWVPRSEVVIDPPRYDTDAPSSEGTAAEVPFGMPTPRGGRSGRLAEDEVVAFLLELARLPDRADVTIEPDEGARIELAVANGELVRLDGPVHTLVLAMLRREGRLDETVDDEEAAAAILDRRVDAGLVGRFEIDRLLRRARETLVHDLVGGKGASFTLRSSAASRHAGARLLGAPLGAVVFEGARRRLDASRVRRLLGGRGTAMRITDRARRGALDALGIEPELALLLERHDGARVDAWLGAAPPEEGLAGALYALVAAGLVELGTEPTRAAPEESATAGRAAVEAAHALAEDGSYFAILGIELDASGREIRQAYVTRRRWLASLELEALGMGRLLPLREEALLRIDEAYEILRDASLRESYARATAPNLAKP